MSDSDSSFLGCSNQGDAKDFNKVMDDNDSILGPVKNQDHHALGIIDRFARTFFLEEGTTNWKNELDTIVDNYNNTPTDALDDHTPNEALNNQDIKIEILHLNMDKSKKTYNYTQKAVIYQRTTTSELEKRTYLKKELSPDGVMRCTRWKV